MASTNFSYLAAPWAPVPEYPPQFLMIASGTPPNGTVANFLDAPDKQTTILAVCSVMIGLTVIFVALRLYSVLRITHSMGKEDYVCLIATASSFAYTAIIMYLARAARHMYEVPFWWFNDKYWKMRFAENTIQILAFPATRIVFFLLYIRVFGQNNKSFRWACYGGIIAYSISYLLFVPLNSVYCAPSAGKAWADLGTLQKCQSLEPFAFFLGACNIVGDLYIIVLPLPMIARLHMTTQKKLGVMAIFLTGIFVLIASVISMYYRYQLVYGGDTNWFEGSLVCATVSELCVAIIAGCMPSLSSLFKHHFKDKTFFASFRSAFRSKPTNGSSGVNSAKFAPWSGYKNSSNKGSYPSSNDTLKSEHGKTESQANLRDNRYVELSEYEAANKPGVVSYVHGPMAENGMGGNGGIMKSVDVRVATGGRQNSGY